jgi:hypothetical protein
LDFNDVVIFQGQNDSFWFLITFAATVLMSIAVWYFVIVGRDRPPRKQRLGESTIVHYGSIGEDRAPIPKFLVYTFIGAIVWGVGYLLWTGVNGVSGYK